MFSSRFNVFLFLILLLSACNSTGSPANGAVMADIQPPQPSNGVAPKEGNVLTLRDFGALPNDGLDDRTAIQSYIDYVNTEGAGVIHFEHGVYDLSGGINCFSVVKNKAGRMERSDEQGGLTIVGQGSGSRTNINKGISTGTVLKFTNPTGNCIVLGDGNRRKKIQNVRIKDLSILSETSDTVLVARFVPHNTLISNLFIHVAGGGVGIYCTDVWRTRWEDIDIWGKDDSRQGTGFVMEVGDDFGGGLNSVQNVSCSNFHTGFQIGSPFRLKGKRIKANTFLNCQGRKSIYGFHVRGDIDNVSFIDTWTEGNDSAAFWITDYAGLVTIQGGNYGEPDALWGTIVEGHYRGSAKSRVANGVFVQGGNFPFSNVCVYRRYGSEWSGQTKIDNINIGRIKGNSVFLLEKSDQVHNFVATINNLDKENAKMVQCFKGNSLTDGSAWCRSVEGVVAEVSSNLDYQSTKVMPAFIKVNPTASNVAITLPMNPVEGTETTLVNVSPTQSVSLKHSNINGQANYTLPKGYSGVRLKYFDGGWVVF